MAILSIELVTVWRGFDSLRGVGGQGRAIDDGNTYFSIFLPPPPQTGVTRKEWQLCTTEGPTSVFKCLGGKGRAIDGRNIYFLFSFFFSNMSGISDVWLAVVDKSIPILVDIKYRIVINNKSTDE